MAKLMDTGGGELAAQQFIGAEGAEEMQKAVILLQDGRYFEGFSFGHHVGTSGEAVFNTGMVGYPEALTDPSYRGQILTLTFPLVGNYGVPSDEVDENGIMPHFESETIHVQALIVADYSFAVSHYTSTKTLSEWLKQHKVVGISGVDTRALTRHLRSEGSALCKVFIGDEIPDKLPAFESLQVDDPNLRNLVAEVSRKTAKIYKFSKGKFGEDNRKCARILAVDCGMKWNILRHFQQKTTADLDIQVKVVPWNHPLAEEEFDGLFLSNGPGDPTACGVTVDNIRKVMQTGKPIFGICLGNQLLALAAGASIFKMKFGNRGMNQSVVDLRTSRCYITPQNHGYAVDPKTLSSEWVELFVNANDRTNEGIIHRWKPWFSAQFHPEAAGGPTDTSFLFQDFLRMLMSPQMSPISTIPLQFPCKYTKILLLGSGGLSIGQAGEFDYSGSQAIKALRESSVQIILVNPNVATVQTSNMADKTYFLPVSPEFVERVIRKEEPTGIMCAFGGQTALNCAVELNRKGIFEKYGCRVLGTPIEAIEATENRDLFARKLKEIGVSCAESKSARSVEGALAAAQEIGYPVLLRAEYALGGLGSGFAPDAEKLEQLARTAFTLSEQVLIDKSLKGWKEIEYEVVRDSRDNCITVCNMENFDPLGIHTGDSIVVAPSQTLTNEEYFRLRQVAIEVIRHFGIVGECNIQYAVDPHSHEFCVIEVNARLSRSSALASKATGYPLAYVAAKLALDADLVQVRNSVTKSTTACFEPSLDYIVTKIPRWDLRKFSSADQSMGSTMKSVGEVMAIGRTFEESFQKALRMVDETALGFDSSKFKSTDAAVVESELSNPSPDRVWALARAFQSGVTVDRLHELTKIDRWFLAKLQNIENVRKRLSDVQLEDLSAPILRSIKQLGFGDKQLGSYLKNPRTENHVRVYRRSQNVHPWVKQIDTFAAEYPAHTNYLYLTYQGIEHDINPILTKASLSPSGSVMMDGGRQSSKSWSCTRYRPQGSAEIQSPDQSFTSLSSQPGLFPGLRNFAGNRPPSSNLPSESPASFAAIAAEKEVGLGAAIVVLGCGCYRIGSSVEFDWSAMSCIRTLRALGFQAIVVNCNPETVSTDYDESDRLYFEDLSLESVLDICDFETPSGVVVSVGGQAPNNLAIGLAATGVNILGTSVNSIDTAENRKKFSKLCDALGVDQPDWSTFTSAEAAAHFCDRVGFPVLVRPSYVLSGAAMRVVPEHSALRSFLAEATEVSREYPVVISKYIENAKEVEMDAVAGDGEIINYAISEHVENAGTHSGDATLILPAQKLYVETIRKVRKISQKIAKALMISGPFNIQFMCRKNEVKVIECNLRASRSFPFISKTFNVNFIEEATRVMVGLPCRPAAIHPLEFRFVGVKAPVFSFTRLRGADPVLGVEMRSTGEVACFGRNKEEAFLKAMLSSGFKVPEKNILLSAGPIHAKVEFQPYAQSLVDMGYHLYATKGTYEFLVQSLKPKDAITLVGKPLEEEVSDVVNVSSLIANGKIDLVINVPESLDSKAATNGYHIRRAALDNGIPLLTDVKVASLLVDALLRRQRQTDRGRDFWEVAALEEYVLDLA